MIPKICEICNNKFKVPLSRKETAKYCSHKCYSQSLSKYPRKNAFKKGHGQIGSDLAEKRRRKKISIAFTREKHPSWKGDSKNLTYIGLHRRVRILHGIPKKCQYCFKKGKIRKSDGRWNIDYANKSGKYITDNISDWLTLCRSCHVKYDNAMRKIRT